MGTHYGGYNKVTRLSSYSNVSSANADSPDHVCHWVMINHVKPHVSTLFNNESSTVETKPAHECLKSLSTHQYINSLWNVNTGGQLIFPL